MTLLEAPADIIRTLLVELGLASEEVGSSKEKWLAVITQQPESPDRTVTTYDTTAKEDGRLQDGLRIAHPGIQIRIRAERYAVGRKKTAEICNALDLVKRKIVTPTDTKYRIETVTRKEPIPLGPDDKQRPQFVINLTTTITQI